MFAVTVAVQKTPLQNLVKIDTVPVIFHVMEHWHIQGEREGETAYSLAAPTPKIEILKTQIS